MTDDLRWHEATRKSAGDIGREARAGLEAKWPQFEARMAALLRDAPAKRRSGEPYKDADDPRLPPRVRGEAANVREQWVAQFNHVVSGGGSEAEAVAAADMRLPGGSANAIAAKMLDLFGGGDKGAVEKAASIEKQLESRGNRYTSPSAKFVADLLTGRTVKG